MSSQQDPHLDAWMEPEAPQGQGHTTNPVLLVHRALRGRYVLAIAIGALLAIPGALVGYKLMPPVYTSTGVITVDPTKPKLIYTNEVNEAITAFESYVRSQARSLESPRVMQNAADRLARDGILPASDTHNWIRLQRATTVSVPRGSRDMIVRVTMTDRRLATASAQAILSAFAQISKEEAEGVWVQREDALKTIVNAAILERDSALEQARELELSENTVNLERRRLFVQEQIEALDKQIQSIEIEVPALAGTEPQEDDEAPARKLTADDYAAVDTEMADLVAQRRSIEQKMASLLARVTEKHPDYLAFGDELTTTQARIEARKAELEDGEFDFSSGGGGFGGLPQRLNALKRIRAERLEESKRLSEVALQIQGLQEAAQGWQDRLDLAQQRVESLTTERQDSEEGRIRISQQAEVPFQPSEDRRKPLAAMGALGGMGFSVAAFAVYGLLHPRYRYVADLEDEAAAPPVLGLVPLVEEGRIEADEAAQAGIHQIRSLLESVPHSGNARVMVITSATAAEGKSTLAAALAASMARAGRRTLLIDADLIGRGVTSRLSARRLSGLTDRVASKHDNGQIHEVEGRENLDLMPAGVAEGFDAEHLSSQAMEDLLASLRSRYEAIVIDTGPILGSLEANAVVPHADQVVLVVSRGQNTRLVKVAIDRLHRFHAGRIGLVFNRAARGDIERSTSAASISVRSRAYSRPEAEQASAMSASA